MSDGPYKSLPMSKPWRDVAERAHKASYSDEERQQSMCVALRTDILRDAGKDYLNAIGNILVEQEQGSLLGDQASVEIDNIKERFSQSPLRDTINANIQAALYEGKSGEDALVDGVNQAIQEYGRSRNRQVEEHYKRDARNQSERQKTISVRDSLSATLVSGTVANLGNDIVGFIRGDALQTKLVKASGLDDGPRFADA